MNAPTAQLATLQPHGKRQVSVELVERARELLDDGCSVAEVCRTLGMDKSTIHRHIPGAGWSRQECVEFAGSMSRMSRRGFRR